MMELVTRNYWQLGVTKDMGKYVEECDMCQNKMEVSARKLNLSKVPEKLQTYLTYLTYLIVNFITKLPLVARKDTILVVYNRLFKMTYFVTTTERTSAEGLVRLFTNNVQKLHGLLESIVSDRCYNSKTLELVNGKNLVLG